MLVKFSKYLVACCETVTCICAVRFSFDFFFFPCLRTMLWKIRPLISLHICVVFNCKFQGYCECYVYIAVPFALGKTTFRAH